MLRKLKELPAWIAISLTVFLSVVGAAVTFSARMYAVEQQIELLKLKTDQMCTEMSRYDELQTTIVSSLTEIKETTIRIEGKLELKADKRFIE